jgi:hypothetical protein
VLQLAWPTDVISSIERVHTRVTESRYKIQARRQNLLSGSSLLGMMIEGSYCGIGEQERNRSSAVIFDCREQ